MKSKKKKNVFIIYYNIVLMNELLRPIFCLRFYYIAVIRIDLSI